MSIDWFALYRLCLFALLLFLIIWLVWCVLLYPIMPSSSGLKIMQQRNGTVELGQLVLGNRIEPRVADRRRDRILFQTVVQVEWSECADAAAQTLLFARVPRDEQRKLVVGELRCRMIRALVQVRVQHVEAIVNHVVAYHFSTWRRWITQIFVIERRIRVVAHKCAVVCVLWVTWRLSWCHTSTFLSSFFTI